jgi:hypothetical protein
MTMTAVKSNVHNFSELTENDVQILVTNNLGRTINWGEFVFLGGYFGEVREYDGIANGATGYININPNRIIKTQQVEATDTFTAGNDLYFLPGGSSAAGKLTDSSAAASVKIGRILSEEGTGGAQTAVTFRPYAQGQPASSVGTKKLVFTVGASAATALPIPGLKAGDRIIDVTVWCSVANASGALFIEDGAGNDITNGIICAVDNTLTRAGTIDDTYATLPATGAAVISVGGTAASTRGIVIIEYIPA